MNGLPEQHARFLKELGRSVPLAYVRSGPPAAYKPGSKPRSSTTLKIDPRSLPIYFWCDAPHQARKDELKVKIRGATLRIPLWGDAFQAWKAGTDQRGIRRTLLKLYRSGTRLDEIFERAAKQLDERNREILVDSLARERKRKKRFPNIDGLIWALNGAGALTGRATADAALISDCLHKLGVLYKLSSAAYRKRIKRLHLVLPE